MDYKSLPDHIQFILKQVADGNGYDNPRFVVQAGSEQGDNYVGTLLRVVLHETEDDSKGSLSLIIKSPPRDAERRELLNTKALFTSEISMYGTVLPALKRFLKLKGIIPKEQKVFPSTPRCLASLMSEDGAEATIILEDMAVRGFLMGDRHAGADEHQCRIIIRELARFHAASFALKQQDPELYKQLAASVPERGFIPEMKDAIQNMAEKSRPMIAARFPEGTFERAKFDEFMGNFFEIMSDLAKPNSELSVICHGDAWINNVLIKYEKDSSIPSEVCFVDFQVSRDSSPVNDLSYFLLCSTTKAVRDKCFKQFLLDYHSFLNSFLKTFGSTKVITWEDMDAQYRKYMKFGFGLSCFVIPIIMSKKGDIGGTIEGVGDATSLDGLFNGATRSNPERDTRLSDVLQDMIENGYF